MARSDDGYAGIKLGGVYHPIAEAWVRSNNVLHPVMLAVVKSNGVYRTVWNHYPETPTGLVGIDQNHTQVTLSWNESLNTNQYFIRRRDGRANYSGAVTWSRLITANESHFASRTFRVDTPGLNTEYTFTVQARHALMGKVLESGESRGLYVNTGQPEEWWTGNSNNHPMRNPEGGDPVLWEKDDPGRGDNKVGSQRLWDYYQIQPSAVGTWTKEKHWNNVNKETCGQGTINNKPEHNNWEEFVQRGCVNYSHIRDRLATLHGTKIGDGGKEFSVADGWDVEHAYIQVIARPTNENDKGDNTIVLNLHNGDFTIGANPATAPEIRGEDNVIIDPGPKKDDKIGVWSMNPITDPEDRGVKFPKGRLESWLMAWARIGARSNGIIVYHGKNHSCVLSGKQDKKFPNGWDIYMKYAWRVQIHKRIAPVAVPYDMPA